MAIVAAAIEAYIITSFGFSDVGESAIPRAEPNAVCNKKRAITRDFMLGGALVKAYSKPVIEAKISERPIRT